MLSSRRNLLRLEHHHSLPKMHGQELASSSTHRHAISGECTEDTDVASAKPDATYRAENHADEQLLLLEQQMMIRMLESLGDAISWEADLPARKLALPELGTMSSFCRPADTLLEMSGSAPPDHGSPFACLSGGGTGRGKHVHEEGKGSEEEPDAAELQAMLEEQRLMIEVQEQLTQTLMERVGSLEHTARTRRWRR